MTTAVPAHHDQQLAAIDTNTRRAWAAYRDALRDLPAAEYEAVEVRTWDRLQEQLAELEQARAALLATVAPHGDDGR